ncbi:hypothetical protein ACWOA0_03010 [Ignavigranum ruoffiae]
MNQQKLSEYLPDRDECWSGNKYLLSFFNGLNFSLDPLPLSYS